MLILATPLLSRHSLCWRNNHQCAARTQLRALRRVLPAATRSLRWDHAFLEDEATIEAAFAGGNNSEGVLGALVEGEAFDANQRHVLARRAIHGLLHFALHWRHGVRIADDLHAARRIGDERVERHH